MKFKTRWLLAALLTIGCTLSLSAQVNMAGRSYHNTNIMQAELDKAFKEIDSKLDSVKNAKIAEQEKEKGRKLTAAERTEIDKQVNEAQQLMLSMKKGMIIEIAVDFTSATELVMRQHIEVDDAVLKKAGVSWVKRKAMKAALAVMPEKQKAKYHVEGDLIIIEDEKDPDSLRLSKDGKYLYGKFDKDTPFKLTRIK